MPAVAVEFMQLEHEHDLESALSEFSRRHENFVMQMLKIINSGYFNPANRVVSLQQAIKMSGFECLTQLAMMQAIYHSFSEYRFAGLKVSEFWQDCVRRAVCARMIGEMIGLDASRCFCAGFMQDIGLLLLFHEQSQQGKLWPEFRQRDPDERWQMELRVFHQTHTRKLDQLLEQWKIFESLREPLTGHHQSDKSQLTNPLTQLNRVLFCADWMAALFTAEDKSRVMNRCREILTDEFQLETFRAEQLLESIPDEVDLTALVMGFKVSEHVAFSQILYEANERLNEVNVNYQELALRLEQALDERDRLAAEVNRDLNIAREIQQSLLPLSYGDDYPVNGINISARILSGDFYDFFGLENGDIYFNLGDVSGKGVNAALLMAKTSSLFRCLGKRIGDPGELLYEINNELCETSIRGMFVTMVAGKYSRDTGEILLVNAGHPPALLFTEDGLCREFEATSPPLGVVANTEYREYHFNLKNDSLYVYSDGVTEGYLNDNTTLELSGLFRLISNLDRNTPPAERLKQIIKRFTQSTQPLRDDVTILLLEKPLNR